MKLILSYYTALFLSARLEKSEMTYKIMYRVKQGS